MKCRICFLRFINNYDTFCTFRVSIILNIENQRFGWWIYWQHEESGIISSESNVLICWKYSSFSSKRVNHCQQGIFSYYVEFSCTRQKNVQCPHFLTSVNPALNTNLQMSRGPIALTIQMWWKFHFALIQILVMWSLQNFANDKTAHVLSCHVEHSLAITSLVNR